MRLAGLAALAVLLASPAQAQRQACVTTPEAEALALVAMPTIIRETGRVCATRLPATSLVRRSAGPFIAKYDAAADQAWPQAKAAVGKLALGLADGLLDSDFARPVLVSLIAPQLVGRIQQSDCGTIDRLVTQLEPLPPRNTASVIVTSLSYLKAQRAKGQRVDVPDLPLCPAEAR
ncbi:hypothetical protein [Sphingomonas lenta]|uniref:Uncharacterized protein n=1 Tax=Sphingomonas lenta TaxID=1141887 RepID=A0A2A2SK39_9SPHN|nr:hypothetical protein [Sphingomonas lenta]PAX09602.1 hypothetical protein CKY28_02340 [Sphingomonas lenta]